MVVSPIEDLGFEVIGVDSAKAANYVPSMCGLDVVFDDFESLNILKVFKKGKLVSENGKPLFNYSEKAPESMLDSVHIAPFDESSFEIPVKGKKIKIIDIIPHQIVTKPLIDYVNEKDSLAVSDPDRDILKIGVVERHFASGNIGLGFVRGFGFKKEL
jgi:adenine deaminase